MNFNSYIFIFAFLPLCLACYRIVASLHIGNDKNKKGTLLKLLLTAFSVAFYAYASVRSLVLIAVSLAVNYCFISVSSGRQLSAKQVKALKAVCVIFNLAVLGYFKYYNFFMGSVSWFMGHDYTLKSILLPLGISYVTFQQISVVIDTANGEIRKAPLLDYVLYIMYFPKVLSGPIANFEEMEEQFADIAERSKWNAERFYRGAALLILGMGEKCIFAAWMSNAVNFAYDNVATLSFGEGLLCMFCMPLSMFFDFCGYCDMGMGLSRMFGIELPVNFRNPFKTLTIVAYWRNWHITLTRFMGKYVYIPLGGNRKGRARMCANMMLVYILSGLWHGANATYILWGALNGLIYVPVKLAEDAKKRKAKQAGRIYIRDDFGLRLPPVKRFAARLGNYIVNSMMFIPFMASSLAEAGVYIKSMWSSLVTAISSGNALSAFAIREDYLKVFETDELWYVLKGLHIAAHSFAPALCMVVIFGITFAAAMLSKSAQDIAAKMKINVKNAVLLGALLSWCILTYSQVTTFIYVNF